LVEEDLQKKNTPNQLWVDKKYIFSVPWKRTYGGKKVSQQ
jgi:hypothetical protein